ncbi:MAG: YdcF family protein, partial [Aquificota bacterium]
MTLLVKLLSFALLPPLLLIVAFVIIGIKAKRDRFIRYLAYFFALLLYLISTEPIKDMLYAPLEEKYYVPSSFSADAIVVLGGGSYNTGILKEDSMKRLLTAFTLHKKTGLPLILSGGSSLGTLPEAEVMKALLEELGVDKSKVFTEVKSASTRENVLYVKELCEKKGYKKLVLVTSAYHMPRA